MHAIPHCWRTGFGAGLVGGLLLLVVGCTPAGPRALLKGDRLLQRGQVAQAIPWLESAVEQMPYEARAWNHLGLAYHSAGRSEDAEQAYLRALAMQSDFAEARFNLGSLLLEQRQADRALPELMAYTALATNDVPGWLQLGHAQLHARQAVAADRSFTRALELATNSPTALNGMGLSLAQRGRPADAWQYFAAAARQQPDYAPALFNMALVVHQAGRDPRQAVAAYERYLALRDPPFEEEVRALLAQVRPPPEPEPPPIVAALGEPEETQADPPPAKVVAPRDAPTAASPTPEELAARPRPTAPGPAPATEVARTPALPPIEPVRPALPRRVEPITPGPEPVAAPVAVTPAPLPSGAAAPTVREPVATPAAPRPETPAPTPPPVAPRPVAQVEMPAHLQTTGVGYPYATLPSPPTGDRAEAVRLLNEGINAHRAFRPEEALELYRRAAEADPSLFEVHYNRGVAAFEQGELGEALRAYEQALAVDPDSVPARFNFATTLRRSGYPVDAAAQLEHLLAAHPNETRAHLALGDLYARQFRDRLRAREHYLRVLELEPQHPNAPAIRLWLDTN